MWITLLSGLIVPGARVLAPPLLRAAEDKKLAGAVETVGVNQTARSTSFDAVEGTVTPVDQFFSRSHHGEPSLSMIDWRLRVEGRVKTPLDLTFADLLESPRLEMEALLECAGNRGFLVSNGLWEGVPLSHLLGEAGLKDDAARVMLVGTDEGSLIDGWPPYPFARLLPLDRCLAPKSLVAFKLNGQFLPPRNGFPARAMFPGSYGMDAVKWLRRIIVLGPDEKPESFHASGMNLLYRRWIREGGQERIDSPVSEILVRSAIAFPANGVRLAAGRYRVWGFAWTGTGIIEAVDISTDGGSIWRPAKLESPAKPFAWLRWDFDWMAPQGDHVLLARARDNSGNEQPIRRDPNRIDGYECNWSESVACAVR